MSRSRNGAAAGLALAAIIGGLFAPPITNAQAHSQLGRRPPIRPRVGRSASSTTLPGSLSGVSAISAANAWAVGDRCITTACTREDTLILHWNGTSWLQVPGPNPSSTGANLLAAVSATSPADAWAVGSYCAARCGTASQRTKTLILHWNGAVWSKVASPSPGRRTSSLSGVTATSAKSAWAVGTYCASGCAALAVDKTLILHWNGTRWTTIGSPSPSKTFNLLGAIAQVPRTSELWAAGAQSPCRCNLVDSLIEHFNGKTWSVSPSPRIAGDLTGVAATSASRAWEVGAAGEGAVFFRTLTERWNGRVWSRVKSPDPSSETNFLLAVSALSAGNAWSVGFYGTAFKSKSLVLHWNGTRWSRVSSPSPSPTSNELSGVNATSRTNAWAVGHYCASACGTSRAIDRVLILRWNGTAWTRS